VTTPPGGHVFYPIQILLTIFIDCLLRNNSAKEFSKSNHCLKRRRFLKILYLVAMATRGITLATNFKQLFFPFAYTCIRQSLNEIGPVVLEKKSFIINKQS
jgi:hypothetical protein